MRVNCYLEWCMEALDEPDMKKLLDKPWISANGLTLSSMIWFGGLTIQRNPILLMKHDDLLAGLVCHTALALT